MNKPKIKLHNTAFHDALATALVDLPIIRSAPSGNKNSEDCSSFREYIGDKSPEDLMQNCTIPADKLRVVEDFANSEQMAAYINVLRDMNYKNSISLRRVRQQHDKLFAKYNGLLKEVDKLKSELNKPVNPRHHKKGNEDATS